MNVKKIPNITLTPGDNFIVYGWIDPQTVRAHVTLPALPLGSPGCEIAMGVELRKIVEQDGVRGIVLAYEPSPPPPSDPDAPPPPPPGLVNGTLVVFEG